MPNQILFYLDRQESNQPVGIVNSRLAAEHMGEGEHGMSEYVKAREYALREGDLESQHLSRYEIGEEYAGQKLLKYFLDDEVDNPYLRSSVMGDIRRKVINEGEDVPESELRDLIPFNAIRWDEFTEDLRVNVVGEV